MCGLLNLIEEFIDTINCFLKKHLFQSVCLTYIHCQNVVEEKIYLQIIIENCSQIQFFFEAYQYMYDDKIKY